MSDRLAAAIRAKLAGVVSAGDELTLSKLRARARDRARVASPAGPTSSRRDHQADSSSLSHVQRVSQDAAARQALIDAVNSDGVVWI